MDNQFIEDTKKRQRYGLKKEEQRAYESIIDFLFKMRLRGKEKARQLDEFDGETLFGANTLYPSQIYAFIYEAKNLSTYRFNGKEFKFTDRLPIVLVTHVEGRRFRGINLNLCNYALRTFILNTLFNLDREFYKRGNLEMANKGRAPISNNAAKVFLNEATEKKFFDYIIQNCKLQNTDILYRWYSVDHIKEIRMIEVWQYKYIPFLKYDKEIKQDVLNTIYQAVGIDKVVI